MSERKKHYVVCSLLQELTLHFEGAGEKTVDACSLFECKPSGLLLAYSTREEAEANRPPGAGIVVIAEGAREPESVTP